MTCEFTHSLVRVAHPTFAHFKLSITPQPVVAHAKHTHAAEPGVAWLSVEDALGAAIPKPVRTLLLKMK